MNNAQRRLVLVVEDSPADREIIRRAFPSADESCDVVMLLDGESAMAYLEGRDDSRPLSRNGPALPDLVLLDLNLPNLTGREVLERIRKDSALRHIPILILTTTQAPGEVLECYRLGANCFLTKPAAFQDFVNLIQSTCAYWFGMARLPKNDPSGAPAPLRRASIG